MRRYAAAAAPTITTKTEGPPMINAPDQASSGAAPGRSDPGMGTTAVWGGEARAAGGAGTQPAIERSVAFGYDDVDQWLRVATGAADGHIYSRNTNPTVAVFEEKIRLLEGGEAATSCASGMAAISNTLSALLAPGRRVVSVTDTYGGTSRIFTSFLPQWDVTVDLVDTDDAGAIEASVARGCDLLYLETPTNPRLKVLDLPRLIAAGRAAGAVVVVDNTFATPINQRPLELGADLVVHSATKLIAGHSDVVLGAVVTSDDGMTDRIRAHRGLHGAIPGPMEAFLTLRGLRTLSVRLERAEANARALAGRLADAPGVVEVRDPGFGTVLGLVLADAAAADRVVDRVRLWIPATSLGGVESTLERRRRWATEAPTIPEGLIRLSVGIEHIDDLADDLLGALA